MKNLVTNVTKKGKMLINHKSLIQGFSQEGCTVHKPHQI